MPLKNPSGIEYSVAIRPNPFHVGVAHFAMSRARAAVNHHPECLRGERHTFRLNEYRVIMTPNDKKGGF